MNWLVGYPNPFRKGFDSSGRISRVAAKVRPHEDWLLLQPFLSSLWPETIVSRCESVHGELSDEHVKMTE